MKRFLLIANVLLWLCAGYMFFSTTSNATEQKRISQPSSEPAPPPDPCADSVADLGNSIYHSVDDEQWKMDGIIVVRKQQRRVMVFNQGKIATLADGRPACWKIGLGSPLGGQDATVFDKLMEGDHRTPHGWHRTSDKPWSQWYHAIYIHYPSTRHAEAALQQDRIDQRTRDQIVHAQERGKLPPQQSPLGGEILLHGRGSSSDWTWGCVALENDDIDDMRSLLPKGMRSWVLILP